MDYNDLSLLAALKHETTYILGRVISIRSGELVFQSFSNDAILLESFHHMDVFNKTQVYFRNLPVTVISDNKIESDRNFSKMIIRKIKVSFSDSEIEGLINGIMEREPELIKVNQG